MSFFDEMKESLVSAGKDVSQKAKEVSGVAKLKLDVKSKEDYVEKQYAELGRTYFDAHRDGRIHRTAFRHSGKQRRQQQTAAGCAEQS